MLGNSEGYHKYLIDLSYIIIPQFKSDFSKMVVLLSENWITTQTYTFSVSNDVISIKIKDSEKFPFLTVSMNAIIIDKSFLSEEDLGNYIVIL